MVTALVFIRTDIDAVNDVAEAIAAIDGVSEVYSVTGDLDLVALVRVSDLDGVSAVVTDGVAKVEGILTTETHIAFRTYSRYDLETAFSIGLD
jgi:DNA-binding Lrp family transcriptional regulator